MVRRIITAISFLALLTAAPAARADAVLKEPDEMVESTAQLSADDRLLIVNGNTGHVIYDDGRNDLFCVTRTVVVGYTYYGWPVYRRKMRCR